MVLGVNKMFDLNLSPSDCSTRHALEIQNMDVLHDDLGSLDDFDWGSLDDSISSDSHTSDSASDNDHWRMRTSL